VEIAADTLEALDMRADDLRGPRTAAVGPATAAALQEAGFPVDLVSDRHTAEGLLEAFVEHESLRGRRVLYVAAEGARDVLPDGLTRRGAAVTVVAAYRTLDDEAGARAMREAIVRSVVDVVVVAAPSAVRALERAAEGARARPRVATIGPVTTAAARAAGFEVVAEAEEATPGAVGRALAEWAARGSAR
jgi:uroporphyrinogen-III synthase